MTVQIYNRGGVLFTQEGHSRISSAAFNQGRRQAESSTYCTGTGAGTHTPYRDGMEALLVVDRCAGG